MRDKEGSGNVILDANHENVMALLTSHILLALTRSRVFDPATGGLGPVISPEKIAKKIQQLQDFKLWVQPEEWTDSKEKVVERFQSFLGRFGKKINLLFYTPFRNSRNTKQKSPKCIYDKHRS